MFFCDKVPGVNAVFISYDTIMTRVQQKTLIVYCKICLELTFEMIQI